MDAGFCSPLEETLDILQRVHVFLSTADTEHILLPWETPTDTDSVSKDREAKIKAIEDYLGVFPDGSYVPLTLRQRLLFWTPLARLQAKMGNVRKATSNIAEVINSYKPWEIDIKDNRLIKQFILGCLTPFKRFALQAIVAPYEEMHEEQVPWPVYILAWIFITLCLIFFVYWIFAWGVYNGGDTVNSWGTTFGVALVQTALLVQITQYYVVFYLPALAMQPQLQQIRRVLADVSMAYINRNSKALSDDEAQEEAEKEIEKEFSVVQVLSPACRAAWIAEIKPLPAAWLLRQVSIGSSLYFCSLNAWCLYLTLMKLHQMESSVLN